MYVHTDCVICQEVRSNMCRKGECPLSACDHLKMCRPNLHLNVLRFFQSNSVNPNLELDSESETGRRKRNFLRTLNPDSFRTNMMK